ncbi:alpha/beta fold hydrolase [Streptomyces sp. NPDC004227]
MASKHLSYVVTGDGPPVVLVHAGVADHRMWDAIVPDLTERHTVIRYDLRGFGESAPGAAPHSAWVRLPRPGEVGAAGCPVADS